jgi:hypothetical protein
MNILPDVANQLYKYKSIDLCSGVSGQILIDLCLNKPEEFGEEFMKKYDEGFHLNIQKIIKLKNSLLNDLEKDSRFKFRDIDGNSIYN